MPIQDWLANNQQGLMQAGVGLLSGKTPQEQVALGAQGWMQGQQQNKTAAWVMQNAPPEIAQAVKAGVISPAQAFQAMTEAKTKKTNLMGAGGSIYNADTGEWLTPPARAGADNEEWGLSPVWGKDGSGKTILGQVSKTGKFKPLDTGDFTPTPSVTGVDLGTSIQGRDKYGNPVYEQPKDLAGAEQQKTIGKAQGEAQTAIPATRGMAALIDSQIQSLKSDPALPSVLGPLDSRTPNISSGATRVQGKIDQIKGGAFLQARQMLKGGGAITDFEGQKAEAAFARMNQAQSVEDFNMALDEFNSAVQQGLQKLEQQAGGAQAPAAGPRQTSTGATWSIEP